MNRAYWIKVFERWLRKADPHVQTNDMCPIPSDSEVWASRSTTAAESTAGAMILVAMSPQGGHSSTGLGERVHTGEYIAADPDACVLIGKEGTYFIPWSAITWVRG